MLNFVIISEVSESDCRCVSAVGLLLSLESSFLFQRLRWASTFANRFGGTEMLAEHKYLYLLSEVVLWEVSEYICERFYSLLALVRPVYAAWLSCVICQPILIIITNFLWVCFIVFGCNALWSLYNNESIDSNCEGVVTCSLYALFSVCVCLFFLIFFGEIPASY